MANPIKTALWLTCGVFVLLASGMLVIPYTPSGKPIACRRELANMRGIMLAGEEVMGCSFREWRTNSCAGAQHLPLMEQMSRYCHEFSERVGKRIFTFTNVNDAVCLVDPWGRTYNCTNISGLDKSIDVSEISRLSIGNYVIWSSGPNGENENGLGDDVFEFRIQR